MRLARPDVAAERWLALASRHPDLRQAALARAGNWRQATPLTRLLSSLLGIAVVGLVASLCRLVQLPLPLVAAGIALLLAGEWLIATHHLHAAGIEEAIWAGGMALAMGGLLAVTHTRIDTPASWLLLASGSAAAGWRLLNPLFTTLAVLFASMLLPSLQLSSLALFATGFVALAGGALPLRRPGVARMLDWLVVAMPIAAWACNLLGPGRPPTVALLRDGQWSLLWMAVLLVTHGTVAVATGLRRRRHAPLAAAMVTLVLLALEVRLLVGLSTPWQLLSWGLLVLLASAAVERRYRQPRRGITSHRIGPGDERLVLLQLGTTAIGTPTAAPAAQARLQGQGGSFGGGGASGPF